MKSEFLPPIDKYYKGIRFEVFIDSPATGRVRFDGNDPRDVLKLASSILRSKHRFELNVESDVAEISVESDDGYRLIFQMDSEAVMLILLDGIYSSEFRGFEE